MRNNLVIKNKYFFWYTDSKFFNIRRIHSNKNNWITNEI